MPHQGDDQLVEVLTQHAGVVQGGVIDGRGAVHQPGIDVPPSQGRPVVQALLVAATTLGHRAHEVERDVAGNVDHGHVTSLTGYS